MLEVLPSDDELLDELLLEDALPEDDELPDDELLEEPPAAVHEAPPGLPNGSSLQLSIMSCIAAFIVARSLA